MTRTTLTFLTAALFAAGVLARSQSSPPPATQPAAPSGVSAQVTSNASSLPNGAALNATLNSSLDSKKIKVGDKVEAHTTEALKNGSEVVIPRGTKLIGHVTEAAARSKGDDHSALAIQFEKAVPKNQAEIPLNLMVVALAAPESAGFSPSAAPGSDAMADRGAAANNSPMGVSRPQQPPTNTTNFPAGDASAPNSTGPLPANSRGVYGLNGLQLKLEANQNTAITSAGKEVKLDGGTRLLLVAQAAAPTAPGQ